MIMLVPTPAMPPGAATIPLIPGSNAPAVIGSALWSVPTQPLASDGLLAPAQVQSVPGSGHPGYLTAAPIETAITAA